MGMGARRFGMAAYLAGALASATLATSAVGQPTDDTWVLKQIINVGSGITTFDISYVDPVLGYYYLADRSNNAVDVINTRTNTVTMLAGVTPGGFHIFTGNQAKGKGGPNGVMTVRGQIWAGDGDSTLKILSMSTGQLLVKINTGGQLRVDEMCYDPVHLVGFVVNNADSPPFMTAISARYHTILGKIYFDGTNGTPNATNGTEQCQFNPRDNMVYVSVPEISGPGDSSSPGGVARIDPVALKVTSFITIPITSCTAPGGLAIGPPLPGYATSVNGPLPGGTGGQMMVGCAGASPTAVAARPGVIISDGTGAGAAPFGTVLVTIPFESGPDEIGYDPITNTYVLPRSGNNSYNNAANNPTPPATSTGPFCPAIVETAPYGGSTDLDGIYKDSGGSVSLKQAFPNPPDLVDPAGTLLPGPQVLGSVDARTGKPDADIVTGFFNCPAGSPAAPVPAPTPPLSAADNPHGTVHSIAVDPVNKQIYVPIASTSGIIYTNPNGGVTTPSPGICSSKGGNDALGCIAVYVHQAGTIDDN